MAEHEERNGETDISVEVNMNKKLGPLGHMECT
jgi:hypothetical protein